MALDSLLRKCFPLFVLGLLALNAYFVASGAAELVGAALIARTPHPDGTPRPLVPPSVERRKADAILSRNAFDSVTGRLDAGPNAALVSPPVPHDTAPLQRDPLRLVLCENITTFITTESTDPLWSVATIQAADEPRPRMRRVGADVAGQRVEYIGYNPVENSPAVWLSRGETLCQALLFRTAPPPTTKEPAPAQPILPARGSRAVPPELAAKIQRVSDTEFHVDHAAIDELLEHQADLLKTVRIVSEQREGRILGVRLFGIRPETLLGTLGMRDGDTVESINGFDLGSPEKALQVYARLRTATNLNVKLTRQGRPVNIDYRIE